MTGSAWVPLVGTPDVGELVRLVGSEPTTCIAPGPFSAYHGPLKSEVDAILARLRDGIGAPVVGYRKRGPLSGFTIEAGDYGRMTFVFPTDGCTWEVLRASAIGAPAKQMKHLDPLPLEEAMKIAPSSLFVQIFPNGHPSPNLEKLMESIEYVRPSEDLGLRAVKLLVRIHAFMQDDGAGECWECGAVAREVQGDETGVVHDVEGTQVGDDADSVVEYTEVNTSLVHEDGCEWAAIVKAARERGL